jgi:hypothetical protein
VAAGTEESLLFFDQLRAAKRAGSSDGVAREHWLTEFGWDTKAGNIVSPLQQAAYLPRAYMLLMAAGTEKGFWFFDLDAPTANQFFDGCGLVTWDQKPKMSYASFAGLTQLLPKPQYVGPISAGDGTQGYVFRNEGKLVAACGTLKKAKARRSTSVRPNSSTFSRTRLRAAKQRSASHRFTQSASTNRVAG